MTELTRSSRRDTVVWGVGVYDLLQASHLLGIKEQQLIRWANPDGRGRKAIVPPTHGWAFSFHDLVSLAVIAVMRQRGVSAGGLRATMQQLAEMFPQVERPLAHEDVVTQLATAGSSVLFSNEIDLSHGGQRVLSATLLLYIKPIEYGSDKLARLWRPADRILIDPEVQVGHPCIDRTRVTTETIAGRAAQGEPLPLIASDLGVSVLDVQSAIDFERRLDADEGLARIA